MYTPVNGIASRFNRTAPQYASDKLVATAVSALAGVKEIIDTANDLNNSSVKKANINYVRTELAKKFAYTNNEKLMMANDTIFYAAIFQSLKPTAKGKILDTEDLDYHNSQIKSYLNKYNTQLIKIYSELVIEQSGKEIKSDAEEEKKLKEKELKDLKDAKAASDKEVARLDAKNTASENKIVELTNEKNALKNNVDELSAATAKLSKDIEDLIAEKTKQTGTISELQKREKKLISEKNELAKNLKDSEGLNDRIKKLVNDAKDDDPQAIKNLKEELKKLTDKPKYE
jgi:chromosome segregation ATPase